MTSTTESLLTNRLRSNSCLMRVRMVETGCGTEYMVWISGAWIEPIRQHVSFYADFTPDGRAGQGRSRTKRTARSHRRYVASTARFASAQLAAVVCQLLHRNSRSFNWFFRHTLPCGDGELGGCNRHGGQSGQEVLLSWWFESVPRLMQASNLRSGVQLAEMHGPTRLTFCATDM